MSQPILDNPHEQPLGARPGRPGPLLWFSIGLGIGIMLLAFNLSNRYVLWPDVGLAVGGLSLDTGGLIIFGIFTGGAWLLTEQHRGYRLPLSPRRVAVEGFWAGVLGETVFNFSKIFDALRDPGPMWFGSKIALIVFMGLYCSAIAWGWAFYRLQKGCLPGLLALAVWMVAAVGMGYLFDWYF